ncbi:MAG TPA: AAA family ATPase [Candidatus Dormibacteraeota bacterium]|jgi:class 3 adenylate cyclase|nr:AAA family ATPase [Candidatus Dormibacteraeota bacterium]
MDRALCPVLVGRERELSLLEDALLAAHRGNGQVIVIGGDAGVGKTRLALELQERARRAGTAVMVGATSEADVALPYLPFVEAIGNHLAGADLESMKLQLGPATCRQLGQLLPQFELQTTLIDPGEPAQAKLRLYEAILVFFRYAAERSGLLLVLEDFHWADPSSRELLGYIARRIRRRTRILLVVTYRSDELNRRHPLLPLIQGWQRTGTAEQIQLEPLAATGIARMVSEIFDNAPVEAELRDFLHERTEGNPFVLEELLKAALDRGDIFLTAGGWDRKAIHMLRLPPTVKQAILLRVERMTDAQTEILRAAAVLGRSFDYRMLVGVSRQPKEGVLEALTGFVQDQLMDEESSGRYRFRHALTREAIHDDLIAPERERLHACAAECLRQQPDFDKHDLAYHLMAAGHWAEAVPVAIDAAKEAEANKAYADSAALYERIVDHVEDRCRRAAILSELGKAYFFDGETRRGQRYLEQGIEGLEQCGRAREGAGFRLWLGRSYWLQARPDLARREFESARSTLEPFGPSSDLAIAYVRLAGLAGFNKDHEEGTRLARKAIEIAEAAGADAARIFAYGYVGDNLEAMGMVEEGLTWLDRSYVEAAERGYDWIASVALYNSVMDNLHHGRVRQAKERLGHFRERFDPRGTREPSYLQIQAFLAIRADGEPERARPLLEAAIPQADEVGDALFAARMRLDLAYVYTALDRLDDARRVMLTEPASPERSEVMYLFYARLAFNLAAGDLTAAHADARHVLELIKQAPAQWSEIYLIDRTVDAFIRAGDPAGARELLNTAKLDGFKSNPLLWRARGRLLLAEGDVDGAREQLERAARALQQEEYLDEAWPARRAWAAALAAGRDRAAAEAELQAVLREATARRHRLEARYAREQLRALGVDVPEPPAPAEAAALAASIREPTERLVTVVFIDVRGYTVLAARETPQRLADQIATLYRWAEEEIHRHQGLIDRYAGDAIMATFNVTGTRLDHPVQGLQAALAIRDKAAFAGLPVGIGIAVGPAVVGQFSEGSSVTAVGETINLASRLQAAVREGELLLSEETYRRTRDWLADQELPAAEESLTLKGFPQPVRAYRLTAHSPAGRVG